MITKQSEPDKYGPFALQILIIVALGTHDLLYSKAYNKYCAAVKSGLEICNLHMIQGFFSKDGNIVS